MPLLLSIIALLLLSCAGEQSQPPVVTPRVIATIPHDSSCFTQGLFYDHGKFYESDGLYGNSRMRIVDATSGAQVKSVPNDPRFFGEGCAKMGSWIVQLTWREATAFSWSLADLSPGPSYIYGGEGWGLTSSGSTFYMSNGSDTIYVRAPDFALQKKIPVTLAGQPVPRLNELEYVNGRIYANVWYSDSIVEINPANGHVVRVIDCSSLVKAENPASSDCVLNGIAWNAETGKFYLTGKKWKTIFVVELGK